MLVLLLLGEIPREGRGRPRGLKQTQEDSKTSGEAQVARVRPSAHPTDDNLSDSPVNHTLPRYHTSDHPEKSFFLSIIHSTGKEKGY